MRQGEPITTDRALEASWKRLLGSPPVVRARSIYSEDHGFDEQIDRIEPPRADEATRRPMIVLVEAALSRAPIVLVTSELGRIKAVTIGRAQGTGDLEVWLMAMGDELERYPADIVIAVCRVWARHEKWSPSLAELVSECDWKLAYRRHMLRALHEPMTTKALDSPRPSEAERQAVAELIAKARVGMDIGSRILDARMAPHTRNGMSGQESAATVSSRAGGASTASQTRFAADQPKRDLIPLPENFFAKS